jgi:hypothetical protein
MRLRKRIRRRGLLLIVDKVRLSTSSWELDVQANLRTVDREYEAYGDEEDYYYDDEYEYDYEEGYGDGGEEDVQKDIDVE